MLKKNKAVPAGRLLKEDGALHIYEVSLEASEHYGTSDFHLVTAGFNGSSVGIRISRGSDSESENLKEPSQIVLTRQDFEVLIASYRAYERAEKKRLAAKPAAWSASSDDFDPFMDESELP